MAQLSSIKEEYSGNIIRLEKSKLSSTKTPVKYDFVAITSDGTIKKAIAQRDVDENKLVGVIVDINNSTNEVIVLTKGIFSTTYFNAINSVSVSYGAKLYLSDTTSGKLILSPPTSGVRSSIALMTKRGLYIDAQSVQEVFMDQTSYDAIKGNIDAFSFINSKLLSLESTLNTFDLTPVTSEINNIKENLKNYISIISLTTVGVAGKIPKIDDSGNITAAGFTNDLVKIGSNFNNATNHFVQKNAGSSALSTGWVSAAFGDTSGARLVIGQASRKAILGGHDGDLSAWDNLYMQVNSGHSVIIGMAQDTKTTRGEVLQVVGEIHSTAGLKTGNATMKYNESTKSLDFIIS